MDLETRVQILKDAVSLLTVISMEKAWIHLFSFQLLVISRADN